MYTLLFLLIFLCVMTVLRGRPDRSRMLLWAGTLIVTTIAFLPHVITHTFHIAL
ncbi:hypothetical protein ACFXDJ_01215 [Streptomyces sp. NPDC059443]|uniref:hypothetical protein n=1 Tax=unclassified Streptomyces TaxID=2593676 RepID=UPI0036BFEACA